MLPLRKMNYNQQIILILGFLASLVIFYNILKDLRFNEIFKFNRWDRYEALKINRLKNLTPLSIHTENQKTPLFYIYDSPPFQWLKNCTSTKKSNQTVQKLKNEMFNSDDIYFLETALQHHRRTSDPNLAEIFIIPVLFGLLSGVNKDTVDENRIKIKAVSKNTATYNPYKTYQQLHMLNYENEKFKCNNKTLYEMLDTSSKALLTNPYFIRNHGHDHIIVSNHFMVNRFLPTLFNFRNKEKISSSVTDELLNEIDEKVSDSQLLANKHKKKIPIEIVLQKLEHQNKNKMIRIERNVNEIKDFIEQDKLKLRLKQMKSNWLNIIKNITVANFEISADNKVFYGKLDRQPQLNSTKNKAQIQTNLHEKYLNVARYWRCGVVTPYVNKLSNLPDEDLSNFQKWLARPLEYFMIGKMGGTGGPNDHSFAYKTRRRLSEKIFGNHFEDRSYIFAKSAYKSRKLEFRQRSKERFTNQNSFCDDKECLTPTPTTRCSNCTATYNMKQNYKSYLINSKFAIIPNGDSGTTSRLYDAIANMQLPIILSPTIYTEGLPFISQVPWFDFCFFVDPFILGDEELRERIRRISDREIYPEYLLEHKFKVMLEHRKDVLWRLGEGQKSMVFDNILRDAMKVCR